MKKATNYMRRILACVLSAGMILNSVSLPTAEELTAGEDFILQEAELISSGAEGLQEEYARTEEGYQEDLNNQEDSPSDFISDTAGDSAFPELTSQDEGSLPAAMDGEVLAASTEGEELPAAMEGEQIVYTWSELQKALKKPAGSKMTVDDEKCYVIQLGGPITAGNADTALEVEFEKAPIVLDLNGYRISRNLKSRKDDGSVIDITRGTLILKDSRGGGEITGGFSLEGGGVNVGYYSTFRQTAGTITGNEATSGGGVVVHGGRFEMTGGEIASNKASNGGGVHVYSGGTFILNGGRITYNKANSKGGGVYLDRGNALLQDGSITGNEAFSGGAVYQCNGSLGINKATLRWNTAKNGGGLYVENGTCSLLEDSLWIVDNTADKGRNVCILGGEVRIGALDYYPGDFYLEGETSVLTLTRRLSGEHRIYVEVDSAHQPAITKGFQEYNPPYMGWNEQSYFSTQKGYVICMDGEEAAIRREHPIKTEWEWSSNLREADLKISCEHCHANFGNYIAAKVTGPAVDPETRRLVYTAEATYNGVVYTDKKEAPEQPSGYIPIAWWELNEMLKTGGNSVTDPQTGERKQMIRLYSDFIAGENDYCLEFRYTEGIPVYLDLNGHTIDRNLFKGQDYSGEESDGNVLTVANGTLVIMDSAGGGKITGGCNHWGGGIYVSRYGNLVLEGGSITGNASSSAGGGIYVNEGSLTVQGGSIQNNMARQGGGVFIKTGDASFTGGTITENRAEHAGGGIYNDEGFLKLGGTLITGNGSYFGGGLYLGEGKAALSGKVTVYDNKGITRDEIEGKTDGDIYLDGDEARLVIEGPLSAEDGRKQNIGMYYRRSGPITEGYSQYHEGTIPSELFSNSQSEGFLFCMDDERKEVVLTMDGHDFQYTWEWEGYTSASLFAVCSRCGERYLAADPSLTTITGPAYSEEEGMYVFTASVTLDGKEYKGTKPYELDLEFVEEVAPYVDEDGSYVFGTAAHFRTIVDGETVYLAQNEDGTPGARVQKEDLRLSWFVFEGEIIARYTGPVSDDPEQVVVVEIPKTYTDENGKTVKVVRLGWNEESLFEQNRFDRAPYRVICTENIRAIDEYTFKNCYLESFTGDTSSLTHIGTEAFANCGDLFTEIILTAQERIVFGPGAFSGNSDEEGNIRLTVKLYHASERFSGVEGSGKDTYLVEYLDEHDLAVVEEETVWADDFHSASFRLECRKWNLCTEKPEFKDVPAEWEEREDDILYTASVEYEGKTYSVTATGGKKSVTLAHGNGAGEDRTFNTGSFYILPKEGELEGFAAPEDGMILTWKDGDTSYPAGELVTLTKQETIFTACWVTTWEGVSAALQEGRTVTLYNDIFPAEEDQVLVVPQGIEAGLNLNGFTVNRALAAPQEDGSVLRIEGTLNLTGPGTIAGGNNTGYGGGAFLAPGGVLNSYLAAFDGNKALRGGGVFLSEESSFNMKDIWYGDGVTDKTRSLYDDLCKRADFTFQSRITNNVSVEKGGGVYTSAGSSFEYRGGLIEHNRTNSSGDTGGGIYVENNASFLMEGDVKVKNNLNGENELDDIFTENAVAIGIGGLGLGFGGYLGFRNLTDKNLNTLKDGAVTGTKTGMSGGLGELISGAVTAIIGGTAGTAATLTTEEILKYTALGIVGAIIFGFGISLSIKSHKNKKAVVDPDTLVPIEDEEGDHCAHPDVELVGMTWEPEHYNYVDANMICRQCGTHFTQRLTPTSKEDTSSKVYDYEAQIVINGKVYKDYRKVQPYTVTITAGFDGLSKSYKVAHRKGYSGSFTLVECPWERENYGFDGYIVGTKVLQDNDTMEVERDTEVAVKWEELVVVYYNSGAADATGYMRPSVMKKGTLFPMPQCEFERKGYSFDRWQIDGKLLKPTESLQVNSYLTATAQWKKDPVFKGHQMVLTGQIGVIFGMEFDEDYGKEGSYMTFTVQEKSYTYHTASANTAADGRKLFTCFVDSLQMAEPIKAEFHFMDPYGEPKTVSQEYSVDKYIGYFDKHIDMFNTKTLDLIKAVADYGHYAQPFLSDFNKWTYGVDYKTMTTHYTDEFNESEVKNAVAGFELNVEAGNSKLKEATYSLRLDFTTQISLRMSVKDKADLKASIVWNGKEYEAKKEADGTYLLRIPDINASQLGDTLVIKGEADGEFTIKVSALSYIRSMLNSTKYRKNKKARNMVMALYYFYQKTKAFRA